MHYPPAGQLPHSVPPSVGPLPAFPPSLSESLSVGRSVSVGLKSSTHACVRGLPPPPPLPLLFFSPLLLRSLALPLTRSARSFLPSLSRSLARSPAWQLAEFVIYMAVCLSKLLSQSSPHAACPPSHASVALPLPPCSLSGVEMQAKRQPPNDAIAAASERGRILRVTSCGRKDDPQLWGIMTRGG